MLGLRLLLAQLVGGQVGIGLQGGQQPRVGGIKHLRNFHLSPGFHAEFKRKSMIVA